MVEKVSRYYLLQKQTKTIFYTEQDMPLNDQSLIYLDSSDCHDPKLVAAYLFRTNKVQSAKLR